MTPKTSIYEYARQGLAISPDKTAIWFYGRSITYRELFRCIDNVADNLYQLGVRQGTVVTIHLPNCPQVVMVVYATAKLGAVCNMVHPQLTAEGLRCNMDFTESKILITRADFAEKIEIDFAQNIISVNLGSLKKEQRNGICFEALLAPCRKCSVFPAPDTLSTACACYLNSSGTTGVPKTVMLSHSAINEWSRSAEVYFNTHSKAPRELVWLSAVPPFHGMGFAATLHHVISVGAKQVQMARWSVEDAICAIKEHQINVLAGVPTMYSALLKHEEFGGCAYLRFCFVSGERTTPQIKEAMTDLFGDQVPLLDCYGLTETVACRCVVDIEKYHPYSVGYPMNGCEFAIWDRHGYLHSHGEGELMISSGCTMMGYLKDEQATADVLIQHQGKVWVKTGDYGKIAEDGSVFFMERIKETIIRKGCNVYPSEVEKIIRRIPEVQDVCVVGVMSSDISTEQVRACVVAEECCDLDALKSRIVALCIENLPRYSVPEQIRFLLQLPRTRLGKTDRKALEQLQ